MTNTLQLKVHKKKGFTWIILSVRALGQNRVDIKCQMCRSVLKVML